MRRLAGALALLVAIAGAFFAMQAPNWGEFDFRAFYCAGSVVAARGNAYDASALGACEHAVDPGLAKDRVIPAPQPPYDLAGFALLASLPFKTAKLVWAVVLSAAIAAVAFAGARLTGISALGVTCALALSLIVPTFTYGQMFALFGAAAVGAALFAHERRPVLAGLCAAGTLIEPHLGIWICASLMWWNVRSRLPVLLAASALAAIGVAAVGMHAAVAYFTTVLPLHARSELYSNQQLGLASVFFSLHVPAEQSVRAAALVSVAAGLTAVYAARPLALRIRSDAAYVFAPLAAALVASSFVHVTAYFAAIPFALLLAVRAPEYRAALVAALVCLAIPWIEALKLSAAIPFADLGALTAFTIVWFTGGRRIVPSFGAACVVLAVLLAAPAWRSSHPIARRAPVQSPVSVAYAGYAQASWARWIIASSSRSDAVTWTMRGISWSGMLILSGCALALAYEARGKAFAGGRRSRMHARARTYRDALP